VLSQVQSDYRRVSIIKEIGSLVEDELEYRNRLSQQ
jgi:hypothetical protein